MIVLYLYGGVESIYRSVYLSLDYQISILKPSLPFNWWVFQCWMTTALSNISSVQVWQFFHWSETATVFNNGWTGDTSPIWGHIFLYFVDYWPLARQANTLDLLGSVSVLQHMRTIHTDSWPSQREKEIKIIQSKCPFLSSAHIGSKTFPSL